MTKRRLQPEWSSMPGEQWRPYPADPRFNVSSFGRVRFKYKSPKNIKPGQNGMVQVCSTLNGTRVAYSVHVMVLESFMGPAPFGHEGSHLDGIPWNNRLDNLKWETHKENCARKLGHGTERFGPSHPSTKLTSVQVSEILSSPESSRTIAQRMSMSDGYIRQLRQKGGWKHGQA